MTDTLGPYRLLDELGRGAMAIVWRGWDPRLEREVAIKEPMIPAGTDAVTAAELATRFVHEGKAAAAMNHHGIVTIYAADVFDGRPAIVMELIHGQTLGDLLESGPVFQPALQSILDQLLDAISYAHRMGVVHRDIKPDNIFVTDDGRVKLADFGIARVSFARDLTQAGSVMGSPGYMSPEQVTGQPVDARADLFSVGAVGYEMLTGRNPFGARDGDPPTTVMFRIVHEEPASLAGYTGADPTLVGVITRALAKSPEQRFGDAAEMQAALRGAAPTAISDSQSSAATAWAPAPALRARAAWMPYAAVGGVGLLIMIALLVSSQTADTGMAPSLPVSEPTATAVVERSEPAVSQEAPAPESITLGISYPADGTEVIAGESLAIRASVSEGAPASVEFYVDGYLVAEDSTAPFETTYSGSTEGTLELLAKAKSASGETFSSPVVRILATVPTTTNPEESVTAYYDACNDHDIDRAYSFYSASRKSVYTKDEYNNKAFKFFGYGEIHNLSSEVNGSRANVWVDVTVTPRSGGAAQPYSLLFDMVKESGSWRIDRMSTL